MPKAWLLIWRGRGLAAGASSSAAAYAEALMASWVPPVSGELPPAASKPAAAAETISVAAIERYYTHQEC